MFDRTDPSVSAELADAIDGFNMAAVDLQMSTPRAPQLMWIRHTPSGD